jgi:hypothetical protein
VKAMKLQIIHIKNMGENMINNLILLDFKAMASVILKTRQGVKDKTKPEDACSISLKYAFVDIYDWCDHMFTSNINMDDHSP